MSINAPPTAVVGDPASHDGRYEGGNSELFVELRLDEHGAGIISADIYSARGGPRAYIASFRTAPGIAVALADREWPTVWQDGDGVTTTGSVTIVAVPGQEWALTATFRLHQRLNGLPPGVDIVVVARRVGDELRRLGV